MKKKKQKLGTFSRNLSHQFNSPLEQRVQVHAYFKTIRLHQRENVNQPVGTQRTPANRNIDIPLIQFKCFVIEQVIRLSLQLIDINLSLSIRVNTLRISTTNKQSQNKKIGTQITRYRRLQANKFHSQNT